MLFCNNFFIRIVLVIKTKEFVLRANGSLLKYSLLKYRSNFIFEGGGCVYFFH